MKWIGRSYEKRKKTDPAFKIAETALNKFERKGYSNDPWDIIDQMFDRCGIDIRLDRDALNHKICFVKNFANEEKDISKISQLSSGEKLILALSLWKYVSIKAGEVDSVPTQVLLLDEFDAHLNPCLMKNFVDLLNENFVAKGVQVIMTTHSPTTLTYAEEVGAEVIWMEDGEIIKKESQEIISELSSGLLSLQDFENDFQRLIKNRHKFVLYVEGKVDEAHIKNAIQVLGKESDFDKIFIFECGGVGNVAWFMKAITGQKKSKRIALLDFDQGGKDAEKAIKEAGFESIFVSDCDDSTIENLFPEKVLEQFDFINKQKESKTSDSGKEEFKKLKMLFAEKMSEKENLVRENFKNFEPLLNQILQAFETKKS